MWQIKHTSFTKNNEKGLFDMDKMKNIEKKEKYEESIKELFKEIVSDDFYDTWADTFEVECSTEKQIIITYNGVENIKKFKKKCKKTAY